MQSGLLIATCVVCVVAVVWWLSRREYFAVDKNGISYNVLPAPDYMLAAERLAVTNEKILTFLVYLKKKYSIGTLPTKPPTNRAEDIADRVLSNYNTEMLFETEPTGAEGTSYTVDKGKELHMCVRRKHDRTLHTVDELVFVALHELAHMGNPTWGHEADFWEVFKFLLIEAHASGIHVPTDYSISPLVYCGLTVGYNPYFDSRVKNVV
jgi:hypothetical protein